MSKQFDAMVIGAGQAGPALALRLAKTGMKVAIAEQKNFGGTCVNTGCIPTKTLIASAHVAHMVNKAAEFGIIIPGTPQVDMKKVKTRKDEFVQKYATGVEKMLRNAENCTVYHEQAQFENTHTIRVGQELLEAKQIFINVGARAKIPAIPGLEKINYFTNANILDVDFVPEHLIIIGGSYIGLEFAQMYHRFGAKVTVIEKAPRLIPREDQDISEAIKEILDNEGIHIRLNSECIQLDKRDEKVIVKFGCENRTEEIIGSHLLLALGRQPNIEDLGLDKAGIEINEHGYISVDDQLQTNVKNIWALGECNGKGAFTHTSYNDYEIVAANLLDKKTRRVSDRILAYGLFIDPPLGRAGMTELEAQAAGKKIKTAKYAMKDIKRAAMKGDTQGFMKVIVDAETKLILGAAVLGVEGDEVIHSILDVMYAKSPYTTIMNAVHIHPTVSELIPTMMGKLA